MIFHELGPVDDASGNVLVSVNNKMYHVSPPAAIILEGMAANHTAESITKDVNTVMSPAREVTQEETKALISKYEGILMRPQQQRRELSNIYFKITLLNPINTNPLVHLLSTLFKSRMCFYSIMSLAVVTNIIACNTFVRTPLHHLNSLSLIIFIIPFSFLLSMLHELGHVSASSRYGVKVTNIGAGVYFGFPVLYSDLNEIWRLNSKSRIVISLAGIYLQLLINIPLFGLLYFANGFTKDVLIILVYTNVTSAIVNMIPFAKLDGYWVISDLASRPNLERDAKHALMCLILKMMGRQTGELRAVDNWVTFYAIFQFIYYAAILGILFIFVERFARDLSYGAVNGVSIRSVLANHPAQSIVFMIVSVRILFNVVTWARARLRKRHRNALPT